MPHIPNLARLNVEETNRLNDMVKSLLDLSAIKNDLEKMNNLRVRNRELGLEKVLCKLKGKREKVKVKLPFTFSLSLVNSCRSW